MPNCSYCQAHAWYRDRATGDYLCPAHARLEVTGPRASARHVRDDDNSRSAPVIRLADIGDKVAIAELAQAFWDELDMECFDRHYRLDELPAYVACVGDEVVGVASYAHEGDAVNLVSFTVRPEWQGQGTGHALLATVIGRAREAGASRVILATANDNPLALALYQRLGFVITAVQVGKVLQHHRVTEYGFGGIAVRDEIQMELRL
jgi:ribosomal protein S18 acetylase RimI-like enzyme